MSGAPDENANDPNANSPDPLGGAGPGPAIAPDAQGGAGPAIGPDALGGAGPAPAPVDGAAALAAVAIGGGNPPNFMPALDVVIDCIVEMLTCIVCFEIIFYLPIPMCRNGHYTCNECVPRCAFCPKCRAPWERLTNPGASRLAMLISHFCKNKDLGCQATCQHSELLNHERGCGYFEVDCPSCKIAVRQMHFRRHFERRHALEMRLKRVSGVSQTVFFPIIQTRLIKVAVHRDIIFFLTVKPLECTVLGQCSHAGKHHLMIFVSCTETPAVVDTLGIKAQITAQVTTNMSVEGEAYTIERKVVSAYEYEMVKNLSNEKIYRTVLAKHITRFKINFGIEFDDN